MKLRASNNQSFNQDIAEKDESFILKVGSE
jgi:hypothetical protein